jgi:Flp pilus assembly protein TadG
VSRLGRPRRRSQRGAFALLFVLLVAVLFGFAALAVDLGNAYQRKGEVQSQVDLAALAGGASLPSTTTSNQTGITKAVCKSLLMNAKIGQMPSVDCDASAATLVESASVASGATATNPNPSPPPCPSVGTRAKVFFYSDLPMRLTVCSPPAKVDFGLAKAIPGAQSSTSVRATATVSAGTPGSSAEMPFFGVAGNGCDYGSHLLSQPANANFDALTPPADLAPPLTDGANPQDAMTLIATPAAYVPQDATGSTATINITGNKLASVSNIAFLRSSSLTPSAQELPKVTATYAVNNGGVTGIVVPSSVTSQPGIWWIRVYKSATSTGNAQDKKAGWSQPMQGRSVNMTPLQVGLNVLSCDGSSDGNFGTIKLPRTDVGPSDWVSRNTATGLQTPLSLAVLPGATVSNPFCTQTGPGVVFTSSSPAGPLRPQTNCLDTDTGLTANDATSGLVTGGTGYNGRLVKTTSTEVAGGRDCGVGKTSNTVSVAGKSINNDVLSCFLTNPATPISAIASSSYSGGPALDPAIFSSPRFCYSPVFGVKPGSGGSNLYGVVDMRPCFITGESPTSTWTGQSMLDGTSNGLAVSGSRVTSMRVIFFNRSALPSYSTNIGDYIGVGTPAVKLVR